MGGIDTFRGSAFQAAYSVSLAFDVLGGEGDVLQVEGDKDVVDAALSDIDDVVLRSVQAKTKQEIQGPAGAGKTTTISQLTRAAAESGQLPIRLDLASYRAGGGRWGF